MSGDKKPRGGGRKKKARGKTAPRRPKREGGLDYAKAAELAGKGATAAKIARAAGSKAKDRGTQARVGRKILARLRAKGQMLEIFDELGYDLKRFARQVIEATEATRMLYFTHEGQVSDEREVTDPAARARAREQYMAAVGIKQVPLEGAEEPDGLEHLSDAELEAALVRELGLQRP